MALINKVLLAVALLMLTSHAAKADDAVALEIGIAFGKSGKTITVGAAVRKDGALVHALTDGRRGLIGIGPRVAVFQDGLEGSVGVFLSTDGPGAYARGALYANGGGSRPGISAATYSTGFSVVSASMRFEASRRAPSSNNAHVPTTPPVVIPPPPTPVPPGHGDCKPGHGHGDTNHCHSGPPGHH